jgi:hypothetical protein
MAINYAIKYSPNVDERFKKESLTDIATNKDYSFVGVHTVRAYSVPTVALGDYTTSGTARFGTPAELSDTYQEMTLSVDKAFTFSVDKGINDDQMGIKNAGKALKRQVDEVITPYVDKYRIGKWVNGAGTTAILAAAISASNIVGYISTGATALDNLLVPDGGRILFASATTYGFLRQADEFLNLEKLGEKALAKGIVGEIDNMKVVKVPDSYMPTDCAFFIVRNDSLLAPVKLTDYRIHKDPPGISGNLVEGRIRLDAFVLGNKSDAIYAAFKTRSTSVCAAPTFTYTGGSTDTLAIASTTTGATIKYTLDGTDPKTSNTAETYSTAIDTSAWTVGPTVKAYASKTGLANSGTSRTDITIA